jgi:hypothetical protein
MKFLLSLSLLLSCPAIICGQTFPFRAEYPFARGDDKGRVVLEMKDQRLRRDETYSAEYTFFVTNGSYAVYNWQFVGLLPLAGQLAVYDERKEYVGDLLHWAGGSQKVVANDDWMFLYGGSHVGRSLGVRFERMPQKAPAGTYYIQLILYKAFISPNPYRSIGEPIDFYKSFDRSELCRSNAIKVEVVDP